MCNEFWIQNFTSYSYIIREKAKYGEGGGEGSVTDPDPAQNLPLSTFLVFFYNVAEFASETHMKLSLLYLKPICILQRLFKPVFWIKNNQFRLWIRLIFADSYPHPDLMVQIVKNNDYIFCDQVEIFYFIFLRIFVVDDFALSKIFSPHVLG